MKYQICIARPNEWRGTRKPVEMKLVFPGNWICKRVAEKEVDATTESLHQIAKDLDAQMMITDHETRG